jgi:hypothetical protein
MTPEQFIDAKAVYKYAIARDAFWEVARTADALLQSGASSDSPGYYATSVGLVTLYRRPFTRNEPTGPISTDLIPREFQTLHKHLSILRNQAFAHTDSGGKIPGHGKTTDLRFHMEGYRLENFSSRTVIEPPFSRA